MHPQLAYIIRQKRVAEMRAAAARCRPTAADPVLLADGRHLKIRPIQRGDDHHAPSPAIVDKSAGWRGCLAFTARALTASTERVAWR